MKLAGREAIASALAAARVRDGRREFVGHLELYCARAGCAVREVRVTVKEYDGPTPAALRCPACRARLKLHHVQTLAEHEREFERDARSSVNVQRYIERERARTGVELVAVPLGVFLDESLSEDARR